MPLTPFSGTLGTQRAAHLLRRATFGASKAQIDQFASLDANQAVTQLFQANLPDAPLPLDLATGQEWVTTGPIEDVNSGERELVELFKGWFIGQMLCVDVPDNQALSYAVREKITFFYHSHFTTMAEKVRSSRGLYFQNALFRLFAFDADDDSVQITDPETNITTTEVAPRNFKELVKKVCIDNAMLRFLDGTQNVKGSPNENYAREMFELYTIGRGLESRVNGQVPPGPGDYFTFTEQDVRAAARVLTGFKYDEDYTNIDPYTGLPRGVIQPNQHSTDPADKEFSAYYNNNVIDQDPLLLVGGQPSEESMLDELDQLINMIFDVEETARHICRKLYRFYVYYDIDETLDDSIIADMAQTMISNDYKIQPVLEELFRSQHFYDAMAGVNDDKFGGIIKSPLDLVTGTAKLLELDIPSPTVDLERFYMLTSTFLGEMGDMGLNFYQPFEVAGYVAYHQFPIYNRNWISTNYLTTRYNFIRKLIRQDEEFPNFDALAYIQNNFNAQGGDGKQLIPALAPYFYSFAENLDFDVDGGDLTKERLRYFLLAFLQFSDYANTAEVNMANNEWNLLYTNPANYLEAGEYAKRLFNAMLQSPEYQLF